MDSLFTLILLMFSSTILVGLAQKIHIPYPIALVLGGTAIGFIPNLHAIPFDPSLILFIVLPPIIYYAAFGISFKEFKKNWRDIFSLALGLVVATTVVIALLFKWLFPQFSWQLAFAFGALISPPDAIAATTILKRFSIGPRLLSILEGESLINDATALVLYRLAVIALLSGSFSLPLGVFDFFKIATGGIILGYVLGMILQNFSRSYLHPIVGVIFSFTIPYLTFVFADFLGVSGILAIVVVGLIGSRLLVKHHSSLRRIIGFAFWDVFIILLNCFVFILIGLQLSNMAQVMTPHQMVLYTGYSVLIVLAMIAVRIAWVYGKFGIAYLKALKEPQASTLCPEILREAAVVCWCGMRGIVSLAAALSLPYALSDGTPLAGRNEVIFITFIVILLTLVLPGLTLPYLIRKLKIHHRSEFHMAHRVIKHLKKVAEEQLLHLYSSQHINDKEYAFLQTYFNLQCTVLDMSFPDHKKLQNVELMRLKVIQAQRKHLLELWDKLEIDDKLLAYLEQQLDVEETHMARAELK